MIDGVTRNKNKYQGIILFTSDQLYFLGLEPCEQATGENIAKIIAKTADKIYACGSKLISVCTDNAANNIAALNYKVFSAQHLSGQNFFRFPCVCHTTNLAAKDIFQGKYIEIFTATLNLIKYFNELSKFKLITEKVPQFKEVRWFSLSKCVLFILTHYNYLNQEARTLFDFINNKYDWRYISLNLSVIKLLIVKLEKDCASIADIYLNLKFAFHQLFQISALYPKCLETNLSFDLYTSLFNRFTTTVQMNLPFLAFFLTGYGLKSLDNLEEKKSTILSIAKETLNVYLSNKSSTEKEKLNELFEYIINFNQQTFLYNCNSTIESVHFWRKIKNEGQFWKDEGQFPHDDKKILASFATIALEILSIPCSECACERAFSHLGDLLMNNKRNSMSFKMLNSLMLIRMNSIFQNQNGENSNQFINHRLQGLYLKEYNENDDTEFKHDPLIFF